MKTGILFISLFFVGCAHPVMVNSKFAGANKSAQLFYSPPGGQFGKGKDDVKLPSAWMRVCSVAKNGQESSCRDSLVLENIRLAP